MGRAIFYCVKCSTRVSEADLDSGKAFRTGDQIFCRKCVPEALKSSSQMMSAQSRPKTHRVQISAVDSSSDGPVKGNWRLGILIAFGLGAVLAGGLLLAALLGRAKDRPPAPAPTEAASPGKPPEPLRPPDAREGAARADLERARSFSRAHPEDVAGCLREFNDLVWKWEGTDSGRQAALEAAKIKEAILERVKGWMGEVEREIEPLVQAQNYVAAAHRVEELKASHDLAQWKLAAEARVSQLYGMARKRTEAGEPAKVAGTPGAPSDKKPDAEPPSAEAVAYSAKFDSALGRATGREFADAIADLERCSAAAKDPEVKFESERDVALLRSAQTVSTEALESLRQAPRGARLSLSYRSPSGTAKRAQGIVLETGADRVELQSGTEWYIVDWVDVTWPSLAEHARPRTDRAAGLAALCLLEGDAESAKKYVSDLAPRWWKYAESASARIPKPDASERSACELFASAEKAYASMETRPAAIESYRALRADYASTPLVKSSGERISRRCEAGKEYFFAPADFQRSGTLRITRGGKLESTRDSDDRDTLQNYAELEFAALGGQAYRCWVWVGACCEETFLFYVQGTEVMDVDAKTRKKVPCEPGSNVATAVKPSVRGLKKTHEEHRPKGVKTHPKTASRWEWVEIPLPKYASPGAKKLRFMSQHSGFSIGAAVVSSTRKAPPTETELRDLESFRLLDNPPEPLDPDLVGWWRFDEGAGTEVGDSSGKGHTGRLLGKTRWTEGPIGGALELGGGVLGVQVEDAEDLRISGDLTLALWIRRTAESGDWVCVLGRGLVSKRNFGLWLEAHTRKYMFQSYGANIPNASINLMGKTLIEPGRWMHLAATIEGNTVRVYCNGEPDGEAKRSAVPWVGSAPLGIGQAIYHSALIGAVDDARIYRRALSPEEIREIYHLGR